MQFFRCTKTYEAMENVGINVFYRFCVLTALITMNFLILLILCGSEILISIFHFFCKAIVPVYHTVSVLFLLSKNILSCRLRLIKVLGLCILRFVILFHRFLFYLVVFYLLSVPLRSYVSCIGSAFDVNVSRIVNDNINDLRSFLIFSSNSFVNTDVHVNVYS